MWNHMRQSYVIPARHSFATGMGKPMRRLIVILISGVFLLSGCGTSSTALPGQPSPLPEQSLPTQPPAATREMTMPEPTATMFPTLPVQPTSSLAPTVVPTVVLPPTAAPIATPVPAVPPVKETPMPPSDQGGVPALPPNAQPLNPPFDGALKGTNRSCEARPGPASRVDVSTIEVVAGRSSHLARWRSWVSTTKAWAYIQC